MQAKRPYTGYWVYGSDEKAFCLCRGGAVILWTERLQSTTGTFDGIKPCNRLVFPSDAFWDGLIMSTIDSGDLGVLYGEQKGSEEAVLV